MKRKKTEEAPAKFWPVPGVDGEPYPPLVQEALDLVEKETLRRKRAECKHLNRRFQAAGRSDHGYGPFRYDRVCEDCGKRLSCEHPDNGLRRKRVEFIRNASFLEFWECNCGEMIARRVPEPTRQTGTDWLKTAEEERREQKGMRTPNYGFPYERCEPPASLLPLMVTASVPKNEPGAFESAVFRALQKDMERMKADLQEARRYEHESDMSWIRTMNGRTQL